MLRRRALERFGSSQFCAYDLRMPTVRVSTEFLPAISSSHVWPVARERCAVQRLCQRLAHDVPDPLGVGATCVRAERVKHIGEFYHLVGPLVLHMCLD